MIYSNTERGFHLKAESGAEKSQLGTLAEKIGGTTGAQFVITASGHHGVGLVSELLFTIAGGEWRQYQSAVAAALTAGKTEIKPLEVLNLYRCLRCGCLYAVEDREREYIEANGCKACDKGHRVAVELRSPVDVRIVDKAE